MKRKTKAKQQRAPRSDGKREVALKAKLIYLPRELFKRVKQEAIDRDESMRDKDPELLDAASMLRIRGDSGVIAQILANHFAAQDGEA